MPNWCANTIAFYQEDGGNFLLEAFYADIQKYQSGNYSDNWVGNWLIAHRIDTENLYCRGFFDSCELYSDHVRVHMETAWTPLPEVWNLMAEKYDLRYVYVSDEPGCEVYINTDVNSRFFSTRYVLNGFDVTDLGLDSATEEEYGDRLRDIGSDTTYYDSLDEVMEDFEEFGFCVKDIEGLNRELERFRFRVHEYEWE